MKRLILIFIFSTLSFQISLAQESLYGPFPDTLNKKRLTTTIVTESVLYTGYLYGIYKIWYEDAERVPFHYYDDSKGFLQMDKMGHAFAAYQESYKGYNALRWSGVSHDKALLWGGMLGMIFQTPIEIFDGYYEDYGFSVSDMVANGLGSLLFVLQQATWHEQIIKMKFSFYPSDFAKFRPWYLGENSLEQFFLDYNSQTYWLSINLNKVLLKDKIPDWVNIAFGYSANGMLGEFDNPEYSRGIKMPALKRYRQFLFSLDIDFSKVKTRSRILKTIFRHINLIKIPFPAVQWNNQRGLHVNGFYF